MGNGKYKLCPTNGECKDRASCISPSSLPLEAVSRILRDKRYSVSRKILEYLLRNVTATPSELSRALGIDRRRVSDALKRLEKQGVIKVVRTSKGRAVSIELIAPDSPENARTTMARGNDLFCGLVFDGLFVDNVRGLLRGGGWVGGDRGLRFGVSRLGWFERLGYAEFGGLFVVDRVPLGGVVVYWSRCERRVVVEARPRRGVVRDGLFWDSVRESLSVGVVGCFEVLLRVDPGLACRVLRFLVERAGFCLG